jgi:6-phosphofructokinase
MAGLRGNAIVGQSGGPTAVINQSLAGVIEAAAGRPEIETLLGARYGMEGVLKEDFINLSAQSKATLERVAGTPGAALGSTRRKPTDDQCAQMFRVMQKHNVRYFFYIGGNDTAEAALIINEKAKAAGYELRCFHVPKTIDNDLRVTDHCPGYGSAAKFVASAFRGDNLDNRSLRGIKIDVVMGRNAGFLTAASALARAREDEGPHLIYIPERPITRQRFCDEVLGTYERLGRCVVAVSEGIEDAGDTQHRTFIELIQQSVEVSAFGDKQLSGTGALGDWLSHLLKEASPKARVRADTFGYLQRSFPGVVSRVDAAEARECGRQAVICATEADVDGSIVMRRAGGRKYAVEYDRTELSNVARYTKSLPDEFIGPEGNDVTQAFLDYAKPLVGRLPAVGFLKGM